MPTVYSAGSAVIRLPPCRWLDMRYVLDSTISRCICLSDQPVAHEFAGQVVEQLGMRGRLPHHAKIVGRTDDALAEMVLPEPIDDHAAAERIVGERQSAAPVRAGRCRIAGGRCCVPPNTSRKRRGTSSPRVLWLPRMKTRSFSAVPSAKAMARPRRCQLALNGRLALIERGHPRANTSSSVALAASRGSCSSAARTIIARSACSSGVPGALASQESTACRNNRW